MINLPRGAPANCRRTARDRVNAVFRKQRMTRRALRIVTAFGKRYDVPSPVSASARKLKRPELVRIVIIATDGSGAYSEVKCDYRYLRRCSAGGIKWALPVCTSVRERSSK